MNTIIFLLFCVDCINAALFCLNNIIDESLLLFFRYCYSWCKKILESSD